MNLGNEQTVPIVSWQKLNFAMVISQDETRPNRKQSRTGLARPLGSRHFEGLSLVVDVVRYGDYPVNCRHR